MKKVDAFVTVEYSLLLPIFFLIYTFLIYIGIYQYNVCLLQNDMYFYAMEGEVSPYSNKYILVKEMKLEEQRLEVKKHSPQNILRVCKRLDNE